MNHTRAKRMYILRPEVHDEKDALFLSGPIKIGRYERGGSDPERYRVEYFPTTRL